MSVQLRVHSAPMPPDLPRSRPTPAPVQPHEPQDILELVLTERQKSDYRRRLMARHPHCVFCGQAIEANKSTVDHMVPRSRGGGNQPHNLWLACRACNEEKANRTPLQWLADLQAKADMIREACERIGQ